MSKTASYKLQAHDDGTIFVRTSVQWVRKVGKNNAYTMYRNNEIYSQNKFKAWCKRNNIIPKPDDMASLPVKIWFE